MEEEHQLLHLQNEQREHLGSSRGRRVLQVQVDRQRRLMDAFPPRQFMTMTQWFGQEIDEGEARGLKRSRSRSPERRP